MGLVGWVVAYLARWFPARTAPGLRRVGAPDARSPVLVTANFSLTVKRILRAVRGRDLWLLVVDTGGINVWCASAGGLLTAPRLVDAVKICGLAERAEHRELFLPALSAPGIDTAALRRQAGFRARFGPVYAEDIPAYLDAGGRKEESMKRARFGFRHRLDMLVSMNVPVYLPVAVVLGVFWRETVTGFTLLFWCAVLFLYAAVDVLPGRTGWAKALFSAAAVAVGWAVVDTLAGRPFAHWGWYIGVFAVFFAAGLDLAGIATGRPSDPERLMLRLGVGKIGSLSSGGKGPGITLELDGQRCDGCGVCRELCPKAVYGGLDAKGKITLARPGECFACGACVRQCPRGALSLR